MSETLSEKFPPHDEFAAAMQDLAEINWHTGLSTSQRAPRQFRRESRVATQSYDEIALSSIAAELELDELVRKVIREQDEDSGFSPSWKEDAARREASREDTVEMAIPASEDTLELLRPILPRETNVNTSSAQSPKTIDTYTPPHGIKVGPSITASKNASGWGVQQSPTVKAAQEHGPVDTQIADVPVNLNPSSTTVHIENNTKKGVVKEQQRQTNEEGTGQTEPPLRSMMMAALHTVSPKAPRPPLTPHEEVEALIAKLQPTEGQRLLSAAVGSPTPYLDQHPDGQYPDLTDHLEDIAGMREYFTRLTDGEGVPGRRSIKNRFNDLEEKIHHDLSPEAILGKLAAQLQDELDQRKHAGALQLPFLEKQLELYQIDDCLQDLASERVQEEKTLQAYAEDYEEQQKKAAREAELAQVLGDLDDIRSREVHLRQQIVSATMYRKIDKEGQLSHLHPKAPTEAELRETARVKAQETIAEVYASIEPSIVETQPIIETETTMHDLFERMASTEAVRPGRLDKIGRTMRNLGRKLFRR